MTQMEERLRMLYKTSDSLEDEDEDRAICPICSLVYQDDGGFWIACDGCNVLNVPMSKTKNMFLIPIYYCLNCHV